MTEVQVYDGTGIAWVTPSMAKRQHYPVTIGDLSAMVHCIPGSKREQIDLIINTALDRCEELAHKLSELYKDQERFDMKVGQVNYSGSMVIQASWETDTLGMTRTHFSIIAQASWEDIG